ncbi:hypothetical protein BT96DRAFT_1014660 [Gymnopus androsaceus JB14]|uniref:C2H2-type domain-containing protein n=1 Tax=Gymnopus androsaceus JB14 TaxID=1447944 RepID=A0A6A4I7Z5_9AGAR|nr:hypothetical protein BT96DRAFT_1014660 [Gymnopus androsaceus JB14]
MQRRLGGDTLPGASFFPQSHGFTIHNSQFYAVSGDCHGFNPRKQEDVSTAFRVIPRNELCKLNVVAIRKGSRFHSAKRKKSDVVVQVFEGPAAKQMWQKTVDFSRCLMNAHLLEIVGISPSSASSDAHYIVFDGVASINTHHVVASMLRKGSKETAVVGLRVVYGIASAFDYISKVVLPLSHFNENNLEVFSDGAGHTRLTFTPNPLDDSTDILHLPADVDIYNSFIRKVFNSANHTIYRDEADQHLKNEINNSISPHMEEGNDEIPPEILQNTIGKRPPRREIIWNPTGFPMLSLAYICQTYNDLMIHTEINKDRLQLPFAVGHDGFKYALHSCEGYLREELTLTPNAFRNAVLIYQRPSWYERCGLCGELLDAPLETPELAIAQWNTTQQALLLRWSGYLHRSLATEGFLQEEFQAGLSLPTAEDIKNKTVGSPNVKEVAWNKRMKGNFICSFCDANFTAKQNLVFHENSHKGLKLFRCSYCGRHQQNLGIRYSNPQQPTELTANHSFIQCCGFCVMAIDSLTSVVTDSDWPGSDSRSDQISCWVEPERFDFRSGSRILARSHQKDHLQ